MTDSISYYQVNPENIEKVKSLKEELYGDKEFLDKFSKLLRSLEEELKNIDNLEKKYTTPYTDGWDNLLDLNKVTTRLSEGIFNELELSAGEIHERVKYCQDLEVHYLTKHNEILGLYDNFINLNEVLLVVAKNIYLVVNSLDETKCKTNIKPIKAKEKIIKNMDVLLEKQSNILNKISDGMIEANKIKQKGGTEFYGVNFQLGNKMKKEDKYYREKINDIETTLALLKDLKKDIFEDDISGVIYKNVSTVNQETLKNIMKDKQDVEYEEVNSEKMEKYLRNCSDLEVLYLKKHQEFLNLSKLIMGTLEDIFASHIYLSELLDNISNIDCETNKYRIPKNSFLTNMKKKLNIQRLIKNTVTTITNLKDNEDVKLKSSLLKKNSKKKSGNTSRRSSNASGNASSRSRKNSNK